ncbi:MAG: membrane protein insertion efficiency factor YidD [Deferribacteraceae bacterium]|nr:membrane protein insertion efficiency factor YidD [Deferribacteraceae bacterium]
MLILHLYRKILICFAEKLHPKILAVYVIKVYQRCISPYVSNCCRFYPTCSRYAIDAFSKKGFLKGFLLTLWRIMRCNPFSSGGYDPVKTAKD